jgi:hypothetical protein
MSAAKKEVFIRRQSQLIHYKEFLNRQLGRNALDTPHVVASRNNTGLNKASKRGDVSQESSSYQQQDNLMIITGQS